MKFTVSRDILITAVTNAAQGIPLRPVPEVYAGMRIAVPDEDQLIELTGSDGEVTFTASMEPERVDGTGDIILPGRLLAEVVRYLSASNVTVEADGGTAVISSGKSSFTLPVRKGEEYPQLADYSQIPEYGTLGGSDFTAAVRKVIPAAAKDTPPILTCVMLSVAPEGLNVIATDASRLARAVCGFRSWGPPPPDAPLPSRVAERFARTTGEDVVIGWDDHLVCLRTVSLTMVSRQIPGEFLPWRKLKPPEDWFTVDAFGLARAVKMAALVLDDDADPVTLVFDMDGITIESSGQRGTCVEHVESSYSAQPFPLRFGAQLLLDGLAGCGEQTEISIGNRNAVFLRSGSFIYSVQPRRDT